MILLSTGKVAPSFNILIPFWFKKSLSQPRESKASTRS